MITSRDVLVRVTNAHGQKLEPADSALLGERPYPAAGLHSHQRAGCFEHKEPSLKLTAAWNLNDLCECTIGPQDVRNGTLPFSYPD
jgi:hypothetical protein